MSSNVSFHGDDSLLNQSTGNENNNHLRPTKRSKDTGFAVTEGSADFPIDVETHEASSYPSPTMSTKDIDFVENEGSADHPVDVEAYEPCNLGDMPGLGNEFDSFSDTSIKSESHDDLNKTTQVVQHVEEPTAVATTLDFENKRVQETEPEVSNEDRADGQEIGPETPSQDRAADAQESHSTRFTSNEASRPTQNSLHIGNSEDVTRIPESEGGQAHSMERNQLNEPKEILEGLLATSPIEFMHKATTTQRSFESVCCHFPVRSIRQLHGIERWRLRGLKTDLMHHQFLGSAWMIAREKSSASIKGGIVADEMGFGKTLQSLAVMVGNPPEEGRTGPTLVVCPATLATQWLQEVKKHVNTEGKRVIIYRPGNHMDSLDIEEVFNECFCVITTYHEIRRSCMKAVCPSLLTEERQISEWHDGEGRRRTGLFHRVTWFRIILDECTAIKNSNSKTAQACHLLKGTYRWLLSATPLTNRVADFYSYLLFLKIPYFAESKEGFLEYFVDSEGGMSRAQNLLSAIILRRTHKDRLFDKKIITLPRCYVSDCRVELLPLEKLVYDICHRRLTSILCGSDARLNKASRRRTMLLIYLRLQQIAAHPLLAAGTIKNILTDEDREQINSFTSQIQEDSQEYSFMTSIRDLLAKAYVRKRKRATQSVCNQGGDFGRQVTIDGTQFLQILDSLDNPSSLEELEGCCCNCQAKPLETNIEVWKTTCGHLYCEGCLTKLSHARAIQGHERNQCVQCGTVYEEASRLSGVDGSSANNGKKPPKFKENVDLSWIQEGDSLIPSSKLLGVKAQVRNWFDENSRVKIIIYTQFLTVIKCLERLCSDEDWGFLSYHGKMKLAEREVSIHNFSTDPEKRILLATLRCGSLGLNLTCASRIINLDLWWNFAVEHQAHARIFRIGQDEKKTDIRTALNDDGSMKKLSYEDLMSLFGFGEEDSTTS